MTCERQWGLIWPVGPYPTRDVDSVLVAQGRLERFGLGFTDECCEIVDAGLANALQGLELLEQLCACLGADAGDVIKGTVHLALTALLAVEGDGKTMSLVAQALDDVQRLAVLVNV